MARSDLLAHESRAPATWSSKPHMYALRTFFFKEPSSVLPFSWAGEGSGGGTRVNLTVMYKGRPIFVTSFSSRPVKRYPGNKVGGGHYHRLERPYCFSVTFILFIRLKQDAAEAFTCAFENGNGARVSFCKRHAYYLSGGGGSTTNGVSDLSALAITPFTRSLPRLFRYKLRQRRGEAKRLWFLWPAAKKSLIRPNMAETAVHGS